MAVAMLDADLVGCGFSTRFANAMACASWEPFPVHTLRQLVACSWIDLEGARGVGRAGLNGVRARLRELGIPGLPWNPPDPSVCSLCGQDWPLPEQVVESDQENDRI